MNKTYETKESLTKATDDAITKFMVELADSPKSRANAMNNAIGFYQGYCQAMLWNFDIAMFNKWYILACDESKTRLTKWVKIKV